MNKEKRKVSFEIVDGFLFVQMPIKNAAASIKYNQGRATRAVKLQYPTTKVIEVYGYVRFTEYLGNCSYFYKFKLIY